MKSNEQMTPNMTEARDLTEAVYRGRLEPILLLMRPGRTTVWRSAHQPSQFSVHIFGIAQPCGRKLSQ
jgi:hypothetical protein